MRLCGGGAPGYKISCLYTMFHECAENWLRSMEKATDVWNDMCRLKRIRLKSTRSPGWWFGGCEDQSREWLIHTHTMHSCPRWLGLYAVCPHLLPAAGSDSEEEITARQVLVNVNCVCRVWQRRLLFQLEFKQKSQGVCFGALAKVLNDFRRKMVFAVLNLFQKQAKGCGGGHDVILMFTGHMAVSCRTAECRLAGVHSLTPQPLSAALFTGSCFVFLCLICKYAGS